MGFWTDKYASHHDHLKVRRDLPTDVPIKHSGEVIEFELGRATRFAKLSELVYQAPYEMGHKEKSQAKKRNEQRNGKANQTFKACAHELGYHIVACVSTESINAAVFANDNGIVVAFRGTDTDLDNVGRPFLYQQNPCDYHGKVQHSTLAELQKPILPHYSRLPFKPAQSVTLQQAIEQIVLGHLSAHPQKPLYFTGHSFGGNLTCVSAAELLAHDPDCTIEGIYSFGQLRVGDADFAKALNEEPRIHHYFRIVTPGDMFVLRPAKYAPGRNEKPSPDATPVYKHAGEPIIITSDTIIRRSSTKNIRKEQGTKTVDDYLLRNIHNPANYFNINEHKIAHYITTLEALSEKKLAEIGNDGALLRG